MSKAQAPADDLDLSENRSWQERFWTFQRFCWAAMLLFILAALFGATGSGGLLASGEAQSGGATITYPRIARWQAAAEMTVDLPPQAAGSTDLEVSSDMLDIFGVESVSPTPREAAATPNGHRFTFDVEPGAERKRLVVHLRALRAALPRSGQVKVGGGNPATLNFVVLP